MVASASGGRRTRRPTKALAVLVLGLLAVFAIPLPAPAPPPPHIVNGHVYDSHGSPIAGADVWVNDTDWPSSMHTTTNGTGFYQTTLDEYLVWDNMTVTVHYLGNKSVNTTLIDDYFMQEVDVWFWNTPTVAVFLRNTSGVQIIQPCGDDLGGLATARDLAEDIEDKTDAEVLFISGYERGWESYLHRSSTASILPAAIQDLTNYALVNDRSYLFSLWIPGGATDLVYESPWPQATAPKTVQLDAGWNNVGVSYTTGHYDTPTQLVNGVDITSAAAWLGDDWATYNGGSWTDIQTQEAGGLQQTFHHHGNAHGFFVYAPVPYLWDQSAALP